MDFESDSIWQALGWKGFVPIQEIGSKPSTIQFFCTLQEYASGISVQFDGVPYRVSWKDLSCTQGFHRRCAICLEQACSDSNRESFCEELFGWPVRGKLTPRCNDIPHPSRLLWHKWLAITLFPRDGVRTMRTDEMMILYAAVRRIRVSLIQAMIW
jgi:hypothetical protein